MNAVTEIDDGDLDENDIVKDGGKVRVNLLFADAAPSASSSPAIMTDAEAWTATLRLMARQGTAPMADAALITDAEQTARAVMIERFKRT